MTNVLKGDVQSLYGMCNALQLDAHRNASASGVDVNDKVLSKIITILTLNSGVHLSVLSDITGRNVRIPVMGWCLTFAVTGQIADRCLFGATEYSAGAPPCSKPSIQFSFRSRASGRATQILVARWWTLTAVWVTL